MSTIRKATRPAPDNYVCEGKRIIRSKQHEGVWLVNGHAINTDDVTILKMYPPDKE